MIVGDLEDQRKHPLLGVVQPEQPAEKERSQEQAPYGQILTTFADRGDKTLIALGYTTAIVTGLGLPSFVFIFGDIINSFGPNSKNVVDAMRPIAIQMTAIGLFIWVTTYLYFTFLVIMSERVGRKTRVAYLRAILQQDISWFDENNATELPSRVTRECATITKALGEKMGQILLSLAMCVAGLSFAFVRGWWMSLILLFAFPVLMLASLLIGTAVASGFG